MRKASQMFTEDLLSRPLYSVAGFDTVAVHRRRWCVVSSRTPFGPMGRCHLGSHRRADRDAAGRIVRAGAIAVIGVRRQFPRRQMNTDRMLAYPAHRAEALDHSCVRDSALWVTRDVDDTAAGQRNIVGHERTRYPTPMTVAPRFRDVAVMFLIMRCVDSGRH